MISPQKILLRTIDFVFERWPQPVPEKNRLRACKLISHRGEYDNRNVFENTLPAFHRVLTAGVWGLEFDIRWTRDLHPVVFHDPDTRRLFGIDRKIRSMTWAETRSSFSQIPLLKEVVDAFGKRLHLMVEIKTEHYPDIPYQNRILTDIFSGLLPGEDFHLLSLNPEMFGLIEFVPPSIFLPVAQLNIRAFSRLALQENFKGVAGHYLFMTKRMLRRHQKRRQRVGTGFINSKNSLFREIHRGVDWIFSDRAVSIQKIVDSHSL